MPSAQFEITVSFEVAKAKFEHIKDLQNQISPINMIQAWLRDGSSLELKSLQTVKQTEKSLELKAVYLYTNSFGQLKNSNYYIDQLRLFYAQKQFKKVDFVTA